MNNHANDDDGANPSKRPRIDGKSNAVVAATGTKVLALPSGTVQCNAPICELIKIVKPVIRELVEDSNLLKMWISFMIPKVKDISILVDKFIHFNANSLKLTFSSNCCY